MALKCNFQLLFILLSDSSGDDRSSIKQMLQWIFNRDWLMLLFGMRSARLQQLPHWDKLKYLKFNDNLLNKRSFYFIYLKKFLIHWISIINADVQCVPIFPLSHHPVFSSPLFFPFLISSKFLTGRRAAVIKSWEVPRGTYYVERTNSTMFPAFCLPVGLFAIDLGGRCQYKERRQEIIIVIKLLLQHVHEQVWHLVRCEFNFGSLFMTFRMRWIK